jgi:hypothetical protein
MAAMQKPLSLRRVAKSVLFATELAIAILGVLLTSMAISDFRTVSTDPHHGEWSTLILAVGLALAIPFGTAALSLATSWKYKWWLQLLPIGSALAVVLFFLFADRA